MTDDYTDLVKRLRYNADFGVPDFTNSNDMRSAADAIEAQAARIAALEGLVEEYRKEELLLSKDGKTFVRAMDVIKKQDARIAELETAPDTVTSACGSMALPVSWRMSTRKVSPSVA